MKTLTLCVAAVLIIGAQSAEILVVVPMPSYSHFSIPFALAKELAGRGHHVTCINTFPQRKKIENYTDIPVTENVALMEEWKKKMFAGSKIGILDNLTTLFDGIAMVTNQTLANKNVRKLLSSAKNFDVVIIEHFFNEAFVFLGHHFSAPVVLISAGTSGAVNNYIFANPAPKSYVAGNGGTLTKHMNFWQRIENLLMHAFFDALIHFYHLPQQQKIFEKYIADDIGFEEVLYNTSLLLTNSHASVSDAVPLVPNIIEIGGFHVKPKPLPSDLQKLLDDAKEGVILFSMGSNLRSDDLEPKTRDEILKAFSKIKQKVLWKFETNLPNLPENVEILPWLPQQDILNHSNVQAFITHGGLLSNIEAIYFGVPLIGIPVFGDQPANIARAVQDGYAVKISMDELSEASLSWALNEILNNKKYKENAQRRSKFMHDQPLKPMDSAVYWVEHVIRHQGAPHLRSAGLDLKWYQREIIDIFGFLILVISFLFLTIYIGIRLVRPFCFGQKTTDVKTTQKKKTVTKNKKTKKE